MDHPPFCPPSRPLREGPSNPFGCKGFSYDPPRSPSFIKITPGRSVGGCRGRARDGSAGVLIETPEDPGTGGLPRVNAFGGGSPRSPRGTFLVNKPCITLLDLRPHHCRFPKPTPLTSGP
jgi:hypothetical protein